MASPKKESFTEHEQEIADFAKAISHPARIAILSKLAESNMCICGEIVEVLPLSQSTVSQHLNELKKNRISSGHNRRTEIMLLHRLENTQRKTRAFKFIYR